VNVVLVARRAAALQRTADQCRDMARLSASSKPTIASPIACARIAAATPTA